MIFAYTTVFGSAMAWLIATYLGLSYSWWAAMTVFLVAQPARNLMLEKTVGRIAGMLTGVIVGAEIFWYFEGHLKLILFTLTLWISICTYLSARMKSSLRYGFVVAGFTAAITLVPMILFPALAYQAGFDRFAATIIGIVVSLAFVLFLSLHTATLPTYLAEKPAFLAPWMAGTRALVVMSVASFTWITSEWQGAPLVLLAASVFVSFLSNHAAADRLAKQILLGSIIGCGVGLLYRFLVLPQMTSPILILIAVWPAVALGAYLSRFERTSKMALDMIIIFFIMAQPGQLAKPTATSVHGACGLILGTLVCMGVIMVIPRIFSSWLRPSVAPSTRSDR